MVITSEHQGPKRPDHAAVAGVAVGAALTVAVGEGPWGLWSAFIGVMLLLVLYGFCDTDWAWRWFPKERRAFAAVFGLCLTLVLAPAVERMAREGIAHWHPNSNQAYFGPLSLDLANGRDPGEVRVFNDAAAWEANSPEHFSLTVVELATGLLWFIAACGWYWWHHPRRKKDKSPPGPGGATSDDVGATTPESTPETIEMSSAATSV